MKHLLLLTLWAADALAATCGPSSPRRPWTPSRSRSRSLTRSETVIIDPTRTNTLTTGSSLYNPSLILSVTLSDFGSPSPTALTNSPISTHGSPSSSTFNSQTGTHSGNFSLSASHPTGSSLSTRISADTDYPSVPGTTSLELTSTPHVSISGTASRIMWSTGGPSAPSDPSSGSRSLASSTSNIPQSDATSYISPSGITSDPLSPPAPLSHISRG